MRGHYPDWIGHFVRDGLASLGDCEHPIEIARPSIKTVQLANEAKLFDWIVKRLRGRQASGEAGLGHLTAPQRVDQVNSAAPRLAYRLGPTANSIVHSQERSLR